jgi:hypothetical protein
MAASNLIGFRQQRQLPVFINLCFTTVLITVNIIFQKHAALQYFLQSQRSLALSSKRSPGQQGLGLRSRADVDVFKISVDTVVGTEWSTVALTSEENVYST